MCPRSIIGRYKYKSLLAHFFYLMLQLGEQLFFEKVLAISRKVLDSPIYAAAITFPFGLTSRSSDCDLEHGKLFFLSMPYILFLAYLLHFLLNNSNITFLHFHYRNNFLIFFQFLLLIYFPFLITLITIQIFSFCIGILPRVLVQMLFMKRKLIKTKFKFSIPFLNTNN